MTPPRHTSSRIYRRAGFTLLELMVALVIGALVIASTVTLGSGSQRHFQEQQRIGVTQRSVRLAMDRIRRDVARAGYLHVPSAVSPRARNCAQPIPPGPLPAVWMLDSDPVGNGVLDGVNRADNGVSADRLQLIGSYELSDSFLVRAINQAGTTITLQADWLTFDRNFRVDSGGASIVNTDRFNAVFQPGRVIHLESSNGQHAFVTVGSSRIDSAGATAEIDVTPGIPPGGGCIQGLGGRSVVSLLNQIEYSIQAPAGGSSLNPSAAQVVGPNTVLVREERDINTGTVIAGTRRVILEFAVDFNVDAFVDTTLGVGLPPNIVAVQGAAAAAAIQATPWQVRGLQVSIAARTPEQDRRFPWPYAGARPAGTPLNRFLVFPGQPGAARVRQLTTEIMMPNLVPRT